MPANSLSLFLACLHHRLFQSHWKISTTISSFWHFPNSLFYRMNNLLIRSARMKRDLCCRKWYIGVLVNNVVCVCVCVGLPLRLFLCFYGLCVTSQMIWWFSESMLVSLRETYTRFCQWAIVAGSNGNSKITMQHQPIHTNVSCITSCHANRIQMQSRVVCRNIIPAFWMHTVTEM